MKQAQITKSARNNNTKGVLHMPGDEVNGSVTSSVFEEDEPWPMAECIKRRDMRPKRLTRTFLKWKMPLCVTKAMMYRFCAPSSPFKLVRQQIQRAFTMYMREPCAHQHVRLHTRHLAGSTVVCRRTGNEFVKAKQACLSDSNLSVCC
jgi:hypothetical protein